MLKKAFDRFVVLKNVRIFIFSWITCTTTKTTTKLGTENPLDERNVLEEFMG